MIKIYCDSGGFRKELKELEKQGKIQLIMFPYENKNKKILSKGVPSEMRWNDTRILTWGDMTGYAWGDFRGSDKYAEILLILGDNNRRDVLHLDSAYQNGCFCFLTRDKEHILRNKYEIARLLSLRIFHSDDDWKGFLSCI